jgi:hypothetical protein
MLQRVTDPEIVCITESVLIFGPVATKINSCTAAMLNNLLKGYIDYLQTRVTIYRPSTTECVEITFDNQRT